MGGPPVRGLGDVQTNPHRKHVNILRNIHKYSALAGSCECGNEPSGFTKCGEFLD